ncbi:hypothetical protein [Fulvivirga sedimenti]|uniref:Uncharacterized protein n=1 Tax=Fulvivirga sedimenti TaxID=2879465 RepID=A0A9X1HVV2_9BACT|nr:hypothetical protein [Fulvivirga sedimenti]MCA6074907.1 hypothetical protein [Fulvivirga sedimenti]MCA6076084.1 hypothetical protein [Fulvivirga sedimenti]MCA6077212.1 hypothetical protein [Fulvivirga sedimenti]
MRYYRGTFLFLVVICCCLSCSDDDNSADVVETDLSEFLPLEVDNYWEFDKYFYNSSGDLFAETEVYWRVDTCCYYIDKLELVPDSVDLGRDYLYPAEDGWIYTAGSYKYLSLEYINEPQDAQFMVSSRDGIIPYEHYILGGLPSMETRFGNRRCLRTLSIYYYQNERIEQFRWFCKGLGEYQFDNLQIEIDKNDGAETSYLTSTILRDYSLK